MKRRIALAIALLAFAPAAAHATVTCTASSSGIAFGTFISSQIRVTGDLMLSCSGTGTSVYTVSLSTGSSGTYSPRKMMNGSNGLPYNIYTTSAYTQIFGDGTGGSSTVSGRIEMKGSPTVNVDVPLYGQLPAQSLLPPGSYVDTIIVTATF